ncbi:hypothetical protein SAMN05421856_102319 [Chryseobacterium taichungense]|uniref:OstA-like protein n=1 Tax=Chryseobacterium taichungense TaxID=295069 RepID=A0A1H7XCF8_9FLAO|nr:hypothetical protein [Chryseobacterium taichungense]SEM30868.1 hypothetical protein SAMN05421856_102319 [Chryseobacterium taichungense]
MNKKLKLLGAFLLLLCSQQIFSQQQTDDDQLRFKGDNAKRNLKDKTTVFTGNVSLSSKNISFENAEKVIVDETTNEVKIYKPQNFKIIHVEGLSKTGKNPEEVIIYNTKTKTVSI